MNEDSQIVVPPSFIALYLAPGGIRPSAPREAIAQRYEFCEDLAAMLVDPASTRRWELGLSDDVVLERTHLGLLQGDAGLSPAEADWVVRRLAELLGWEPLPSAGAGSPRHGA